MRIYSRSLFVLKWLEAETLFLEANVLILQNSATLEASGSVVSNRAFVATQFAVGASLDLPDLSFLAATLLYHVAGAPIRASRTHRLD